MPENSPHKQVTDSTISLFDLFAAVLERIWLVAACLILGVLGGFYQISKTPLTYASSALVQVEPPRNVVDIQKVNPDETRDKEAIATMLQLFRSQPFLIRVATNYKLTTDPAFWGAKPGTVINATQEQTAGALAGLVTASLRPATRLIDVTVEHGNPEMCQRLANAIAKEFIVYKKDEGLGKTDSASLYLEEQTVKLKDQLEKSERKLQDFREKYQTVGLEDSEIATINNKASDANRVRLSLESDLKQIDSHPTDAAKLLGLDSISTSASVTNLRASIARQQEKIAQMQQRYTALHPKLIRAKQELESMEQGLKDAAIEAVSSVRPRYEAALAQENSLRDVALSRNRLAIDFNSIQSDVQTNRSLYDAMLKRRSETDVTRAMEFDQIRVVQNAAYPGYPIKPDKKRIWTMSIGAGLAAGLLIAFAFYFLDNTIKRVEKAEAIFKLPVLTVVPESQLKKKEKTDFDALAEVEATVNESFRSLIVALNLLGGPPGCKVCLFTSSVPGEGKSFCSFHTARHLASQSKRTLLIDVDLRRPSLHRLTGQSEDARGVTDFLSGQASIAEVIYPTQDGYLSYLPAGTRAPNPIKLLSDGGFSPLLDAVKPNYDYIILDTAPINAVADTLLLSELADQICLIIHSGKTSIHGIRRAIQQLASSRREPSGIILNRFLARRGAYYYYSYSYNKSYGPDGVYGRDDVKPTDKKRSTQKIG